ncbi:4-hydroxy-tetrahydrodipicolinate synthase [bacterium]|nr:4-hydroxy-tetrahydrodipicolinate synthase [bacterium]
MKSLSALKGCGTALVTPFSSSGDLDEEALRRLVNFQIDEGIDFLVPCGTTGENPTLTEDEHLKVVSIVVEESKGRVPIIAGAGGYNTIKVIEMARKVIAVGADGILSVAPYYNKPTQEGIYEHYKEIAGAVDAPIVVYNVPGRTGVNILPDTVARLSEITNIIALKAASGNVSQIAEVAVKTPSDFKIISGDDAITLPIIALGGVGVISVVSNQVPKLMVKFVQLCLKSKFDKAMEIQKKLFPLIKLDFITTNPIPVKAGLAMMGLIEEQYRLPLVPMSREQKELLRRGMDDLGLLKKKL